MLIWMIVNEKTDFVYTAFIFLWMCQKTGNQLMMAFRTSADIRSVNHQQELIDRIYKYCDEVNAHPVQYHRTYKMDEISIEAADADIDPELQLID